MCTAHVLMRFCHLIYRASVCKAKEGRHIRILSIYYKYSLFYFMSLLLFYYYFLFITGFFTAVVSLFFLADVVL